MDDDEVVLLHSLFFLRDGALYRKSTGKAVTSRNPKSYPQVSAKVGGKVRVWRVHRAVFALAHGYLPPIVDHKNRDKTRNSLSNLRPATRAQNAWNHGFENFQRSLPEGVGRKGKRFRAYAQQNGRQVHLGTHDTPEAAATAVSEWKRQNRGDFHNEP